MILASVLGGGHLELPSLRYTQWCRGQSLRGNWNVSRMEEMDVGTHSVLNN